MPGEETSADAHTCVIWITRKEIRTSVSRVRTGIFPLASLECYWTKSPIHSYPHYWKSESGSCLHHVTSLQMKTICWLLQAVLSVRQLHDQASILAFGSPPPFLCYSFKLFFSLWIELPPKCAQLSSLQLQVSLSLQAPELSRLHRNWCTKLDGKSAGAY